MCEKDRKKKMWGKKGEEKQRKIWIHFMWYGIFKSITSKCINIKWIFSMPTLFGFME